MTSPRFGGFLVTRYCQAYVALNNERSRLKVSGGEGDHAAMTSGPTDRSDKGEDR